MLKVYRLLRNNRETGPYTLDELLQTDLKPQDLIWVEGKSCSWAYPYEIDTLKTHVPPPPPKVAKGPAAAAGTQQKQLQEHPVAPKHIYVSLPNNPKQQPSGTPPAEQRAELLGQEASYKAPAMAGNEAAEVLQTTYARSLDEAENAYTHWIYKQKTRKKSGTRKYVLTIGLLAAVITGGLFANQYLRKPDSDIIRPVNTEEQTSAQATSLQKTVLPANTSSDAVFQADTLLLQKPIAAQPVPQTKEKIEKVNKEADIANQPPATPPPIAAEEPAQQNEPTQPITRVEEKPTNEAPVVEEQEKKGLFGGLFKKRKKEEEQKAAEPGATAAEQDSRKARRRNLETNPVINLSEHIELRSSIKKDNWMLGIVGQNLTLHNHSQEMVKNAAVEVSYFSEENSLLLKKVLQFSNVAPKGQATMALPEHRLAERAKFKLLSATSANTVAKQ